MDDDYDNFTGHNMADYTQTKSLTEEEWKRVYVNGRFRDQHHDGSVRCTHCGEPDLETERQGSCSCHINPPCSACEQAPYICRWCGEQYDYDTDQSGYNWAYRSEELLAEIKTLQNRIITYRTAGAGNSRECRTLLDKLRGLQQVYNHFLDSELEIQQKEIHKLKQKRKGKSTMKSVAEIRKIVALVSDELTTVKCKWKGSTGQYTFMILKSLAEKLEKDDWVVAHTAKQKYAAVQVVEIHKKSEVDIDFDHDYDFVFQKVDVAGYNALEDKMQEMVNKINDAQVAATQETVLKAMGLEKSDLGAFQIEDKSDDASKD